ncbi:hypothetical protein G6N05_08490 [Flavobacterium sp. F372]|uniref:ATP-grasp domain-containing protein n=2 Tax=Flavobacterium bernardetii TaxID=2813823 RepID=A0ABR7IWQ3_9FLAO|nr:hypothetical protein [Flavobacterium bernardetii]NHF70146.1 hypothetical protein [Flavobacterium bernardetii]
MEFKIRNIHSWMIFQKSKEMQIESEFLVPGVEDFIELKKGKKRVVINRAISPSLTHIAGAITENKIACNYLLQENNYPIPAFIFASEIGKIELLFLEKFAPIVVKPFDTNKGAEIHMNVQNTNELKEALNNVKKVSTQAILQQQATGLDYRFLVIDRQVTGVLWNEWPSVVGDGIHTIENLVQFENENRRITKTVVYEKPTEMLVEIPIEGLSDLLAKSNKRLSDILPKGEKIYLGNCGNGWTGSVAHDATDNVHPSINKKVIELINFLDIDIAGLDVRCDDITKPFKKAGFNVIEVNTRPSLVDHEFPLFGKSRNVTEKYLDYLFKD